MRMEQRAAEVMEQAWCEQSRSTKPEGSDRELGGAWEKLHSRFHDMTRDEVAMFASALAEAGCLAPDPPEPDRGMFGGGSVWYTNIRFAHDIRTSRNGNVVVMSLDSQDHPYRIVATPDEIDTFITYLAAASAAARAEKEQA